jgi:hypothetical protein
MTSEWLHFLESTLFLETWAKFTMIKNPDMEYGLVFLCEHFHMQHESCSISISSQQGWSTSLVGSYILACTIMRMLINRKQKQNEHSIH